MMNNSEFLWICLTLQHKKIVLLHAGGRTGKNFVTCKIFEELALCNEICNCTCPTRVGALHLLQGQIFHSVFRTWTPSLSAGTVIDEIFKSLAENQLKMVMVDEFSMLSAQFFVPLDTRLCSMYNSDQTFGGISILLIGDFIQLPVRTERDLWNVMYGTISGNNGTAHNLFQQFCAKELTVNIQSSECKIHMQRVAGFRALPQVYSSGQKWTAEDSKLYKPITKDIVDGVTHELTLQDIEQDPNWITKSKCIVTSKVDRAIISADAAKAFSKRNNVPVLQRKYKLSLDSPLSAKAILYDKDERPELFAYFVQGGSGQVLDNVHGNVYFGVANGTACTMHSLAWDDPEDEENAHKAIQTSTKGQVIDLPKPPDHIIVDIKPVKGEMASRS
jgi:hypothetical protein